ncbi:hypothetical protein ACEPAI_3565 [Sanghuangporus weigelae]
MLGVLHFAVSDFSSFCYPRSVCSSAICTEVHETAIEERYCPKEHVHYLDDQEWEELLARELGLLDESDDDDDDDTAMIEMVADHVEDNSETVEKIEDEDTPKTATCAPPSTPNSTLSTPSLIGGNGHDDDGLSSTAGDSDSESDYIAEKDPKKLRVATRAATAGHKRKRGKGSKILNPRKRLCRSDSTSSVATTSSIASIGSNPSSTTAQLLQAMMNSDNPWKCPHCPWVQHTQRLPDFLRHQRSHFVSQSDWPCPNPKCGKGFARKDSLKRHLDNKATGCKRPPGYTIC